MFKMNPRRFRIAKNCELFKNQNGNFSIDLRSMFEVYTFFDARTKFNN